MTSLLAGLGLAATAALLLAPRPGRKTGGDIQELARNSYPGDGDPLQDLLERASRQMQSAAAQAGQEMDDAVNTACDRAESAAGQLREEAVKLCNQGKDTVGGNGLMSILNDWPLERLIEIDGVGPVLAGRIIQHRPYESEQQLIESKQLPPSAIESLRNAA